MYKWIKRILQMDKKDITRRNFTQIPTSPDANIKNYNVLIKEQNERMRKELIEDDVDRCTNRCYKTPACLNFISDEYDRNLCLKQVMRNGSLKQCDIFKEMIVTEEQMIVTEEQMIVTEEQIIDDFPICDSVGVDKAKKLLFIYCIGKKYTFKLTEDGLTTFRMNIK